MKTKMIPAIITLAAAAVTCAASLIEGISFKDFTMRLLWSVVIFLIIGTVVKFILDKNFNVSEEQDIDEAEATEDSDNTGENLENIDSDDSDEESDEYF